MSAARLRARRVTETGGRGGTLGGRAHGERTRNGGMGAENQLEDKRSGGSRGKEGGGNGRTGCGAQRGPRPMRPRRARDHNSIKTEQGKGTEAGRIEGHFRANLGPL